MWAYPGIGRRLYLSTYSGPTSTSQITYPENAVLAASALSDSEPISDAMTVTLTINYNVVPTDVTTVQFDNEPTFTDPITLTTLAASATDKVGVLTITNPLPGFIRVQNTSTVQINAVFVNKQISTNY